jgi:methyl-accepting chemotaxis protein
MAQPDSKIQEIEDMNDFSQQMDLISNHSTNIVDQLPAYNPEDTQSFLNNLKTEYEQQKTLNAMLNNKDLKKQISKMKDFTKNNTEKIDKQLTEIKDISLKLQEIVTKNQEMKEQSQEIKEMAQSQEYNDIAKKLREIKAEKENIKIFLTNSGIIAPPLII